MSNCARAQVLTLPPQANEWVDLADGKAHKIVVTRKENQVFLKVDDGAIHHSALSGIPN